MKATISQVFLQTSRFILQFQKRYLSITSWTFLWKVSSKRIHWWLLWNLFQKSHQLAPWVPRPDKGHWGKAFDYLQFFTVEPFLMIFCYTELLFPRHSECDRTLISTQISRAECLEKFFSKTLRKKFPGRQT